jgi:hypothetical protein
LRYSGWEALLRVTSEVRVPYEAIVALTVGVDDLPHPFAMRVGLNAWPTDIRRGQFWLRGKRMLYDLGNRRRAIALELRNNAYARVVFEPEADPERFADEIRGRAPWLKSP